MEYLSQRKHPFGFGFSNIAVEPGGRIEAGALDNFLTARYRLYTVHRDRLFFAAIEHEPWPLQGARLLHLEHDLIQKSGMPKEGGEPVVHFSANLAVRIGRLQRLRARSGGD